MIKFKCDFCQQRLGVPDGFIGKHVRCTKCRAVNTVPTPQEYAAKEAARAAAALPAVMRATLPSDPKPKPKAALPSRVNPLLDLSSGSGSFSGNGSGLLALESAAGMSESKIFNGQAPPPAFVAGEQVPLEEEPGEASDGSVVGLFDTGEEMPALHSTDKPKPAPIAEHDAKKNGPPPPRFPPPDDEDFGLGLLEEDPIDSSPGKVDLDGLGF